MAKHFKQDAGRPTTSSRHGRHRSSARGIVTLTLALAVVGAAVGGVVAWLFASNQVQNQFELGQVTPTVKETFDDTTKKDVSVTNSGNVPIYVRAQVNIYWQDENGNQLWEEPVKGEDYTIDWGDLAGSSWKLGSDGFYYWTQPLAADSTTGLLIDKLEWTTAESSDGRTLVCDVAVQGIQADPAHAVQEAWGATVDSDTGTLTPKTGE